MRKRTRFLFFAILFSIAARCAASDPIQENFGARSAPYPGFLVLPPEAVPPGFEQVRHHYTKRAYTLDFKRMVDGKQIDLNIVESDYTEFFHSDTMLVLQFDYLGIPGQVYLYDDKQTRESTLNLIWLNPPKQRIAIYLTQTAAGEYTPQDLVNILTSMRNIDQEPGSK